jgi:hypothetical protein
MYYTGIGSRSTPATVLALMTAFARRLAQLDWILRSGGAPGADTAFENGAGGRAEIFVPWRSFERALPSYHVLSAEMLERALLLASVAHPAWGRCSQGERLLHARNIPQVWGADLNSPSEFVLCWAPESAVGKVSGGTNTAVVIGRQAGIPVFNLARDGAREQFETFMQSRAA